MTPSGFSPRSETLLADDPRTDPMTKSASPQARLDSHHGVEPSQYVKAIHPGLRRAPGYDEYKQANNSVRKRT